VREGEGGSPAPPSPRDSPAAESAERGGGGAGQREMAGNGSSLAPIGGE
jgi:hypothetical protein